MTLSETAYAEVARLVKRFKGLTTAARKKDRRHALKRRIEKVDAAIDKRVYDLYGLTEKEIRAIEATDAFGHRING
jgi:hypothetical protein